MYDRAAGDDGYGANLFPSGGSGTVGRVGRGRDQKTGSALIPIARLTLLWNSGVIEGHVNRIKMLKRQMLGRAGFGLLRKRVLFAP
ncbi:hypothetical protein ACGFZH_22750 [Streptomyces zaomyceticus]|uniref:hypothetical protein n=1 Tax=Streptomyces zaomyceticus TaxID=68286 RepID=UPI003722B84A